MTGDIMENLVRNNKCFSELFRGTYTITGGINASETKIITIQIEDELRSGMVCIANSVDWPLRVEVQEVGNNTISTEYTGFAIVSVTNETGTSIGGNVDINYLFI